MCLLLPHVSSETLFWAGQLCLVPVSSRRNLDFFCLLPAVSCHPGIDPTGQLQPDASGSACCSGHQVMGKAPEWEHSVEFPVLPALAPCSHSRGPHSCAVQAHTKQWPQRAEAPLEDLEEEQLPHCVFNFLCNPERKRWKCWHDAKVPFSHPLAPLGMVSSWRIWSAEPEFLRWVFIMSLY